MFNYKSTLALLTAAVFSIIGISALLLNRNLVNDKRTVSNAYAATPSNTPVPFNPFQSDSTSARERSIIEKLRSLSPVTPDFKTGAKTGLNQIQAGTASPSTPDITVVYIKRTPRYNRYCVHYPNDVPTLCPGTENQKRWPDVGEPVTYEAHITNNGNTFTDTLQFDWLVNDVVVSTGEATLAVEQHVDIPLSTYTENWTETKHPIEFRVRVKNNNVVELTTDNNLLSIGTHDLTLSYWVETKQYQAFNALQNVVGTYSFEDWMNAHIKMFNQRLRDAVYPDVPQGVTDQIRLDKFVVADELDSGSSPRSLDPDLYFIDGRWQSTDYDSTNANGNNGFYTQYAQAYAPIIDWGLIHELTHQIGGIDLYRMRIPNGPPNDGLQMNDVNGNLVTNARFPNGGNTFPNWDLMDGGDITPYTDHRMFSFHSAAGLQSNAGHRRGFYGEYLYDMPDSTTLQILDSTGNPVANAQVDMFQQQIYTELFDNIPEISGVTDAEGKMLLPNRPAPSVTTITGHTQKPNPFGLIYVTGSAGMMATRVIKDGKDGYVYFLIHDLNVAYWKGQKTNALVTLKTTFPPYVSPTPPHTPTPTKKPTKTPTPTRTPTPTKKPTSTPVPSNLLMNPSFETDSDGNGMPNNWSMQNRTSSTDKRVSTYKMDGSYAFYMKCLQGKSKYVYQEVSGKWLEGKTITFTANSKTVNVSGSVPTIDIIVTHSDGSKKTLTTALLPATSHDWTPTIYSYTLTKQAKRVAYRTVCNKGVGEVYLDGMSVFVY